MALAIFNLLINVCISVSPTNNIFHLWSAFYMQADTVLDATHLPSIIIPISKMRKQSLKEIRTQMSNLSRSPAQPGLGVVLTVQMSKWAMEGTG